LFLFVFDICCKGGEAVYWVGHSPAGYTNQAANAAFGGGATSAPTSVHSIENADPCHSNDPSKNPCQNGGKCNVWDDTGGDIEYHCKCPHGYAQPDCL
jgi:hypothetical protein